MSGPFRIASSLLRALLTYRTGLLHVVELSIRSRPHFSPPCPQGSTDPTSTSTVAWAGEQRLSCLVEEYRSLCHPLGRALDVRWVPVPPEVITLAERWYLRFGLSYLTWWKSSWPSGASRSTTSASFVKREDVSVELSGGELATPVRSRRGNGWGSFAHEPDW